MKSLDMSVTMMIGLVIGLATVVIPRSIDTFFLLNPSLCNNLPTCDLIKTPIIMIIILLMCLPFSYQIKKLMKKTEIK